MFSLSDVQNIYNYAMRGYHQTANQKPQDAVNHAAKVAAAATTVANKEAKMANKVKETVLTAGIESTLWNACLSGELFKEAFDQHFAVRLKDKLEKLLGVQNLQLFVKPVVQLAEAASSAAVSPEVNDTSLMVTDSITSVLPNYNPHQFFQEDRGNANASNHAAVQQVQNPEITLFSLERRQ